MNSAALLFSPAVQRTIKSEAFRVWSPLRRFGYEIDDLRQEFALHLFLHLDQYDESRASLPTFVRRACRNKSLQLIEKETAKKRNGGTIPQSLSAALQHDDADPTEDLSDIISEDEFAIRMSGRSRPAAELLMLHLDAERAISKLPAELVEVAHLLAAHEPVGDIDRTQGISRSSGARRRVRIRTIFVTEGLAAYVETREAA